ncbi:unnamed protein product [Owenia fusiformis]|uniref:SWIM-type domain-containing protein n=1 Tax=Owenia fusiformis TaxID=6347 RepID=A0A8S4NUS3_OWEFU|nr:unnamed protein product [Owenia fusiformis]
MTSPDKMKSLFQDLGKPTMRGVRKCPNCGIFNGTRGVTCKNKQCGMVFKSSGKRKNNNIDAVKVITGSTVQVFSARIRDRGPDYRSFVELPLVQDMDGNVAESVDPEVLSAAARCYAESCPNNPNNQKEPTDLEVEIHPPCTHIKSAINCITEAEPLTLKNSILNSLQVSNETKQAIWLLATETTGPLVQRVTKNVMVVKCKPSGKHPLGFLHFTFYETSRQRSVPEHKFQCSCRQFKVYKTDVTKEECQKRCVHFYACICAFASEEKLAQEFEFYINLDSSAPERRLLSIYTTAASQDNTNVGDEGEEVAIIIDQDNSDTPAPEPAKKRKKDDSVVQASNALLTLQDSLNTPTKEYSPLKHKPTTPGSTNKTQLTPAKKSLVLGGSVLEEETVEINFHQWLGSVTERINQTMHYQFDGNPEPLVFHAPQIYFDCLQQRISGGQKKKRLPNSTTGFIRKDALPLGTFMKYTWHITNILQVKQIFDTPDMTLDVTRSFIENRDGTYDCYEVPSISMDNIMKKQTPIRPFELKTYLKVGMTAPDQTEATPFIIEWIPDILPKSRIGELRIKFEYGHQRNGHKEDRTVQALAQPLDEVPPTLYRFTKLDHNQS